MYRWYETEGLAVDGGGVVCRPELNAQTNPFLCLDPPQQEVVHQQLYYSHRINIKRYKSLIESIRKQQIFTSQLFFGGKAGVGYKTPRILFSVCFLCLGLGFGVQT